ncbi:MAG: amidase [Pigmentiphaga sp.]|uniref:amidase n=1 Tax=Pigmentiphaga sp. TaxID=1977564 RepID=UPI0029B68251|nr:amidase [Pigmentiphaga sp.]MDX3908050.1 amidase [Pigmentiphaga sp.]
MEPFRLTATEALRLIASGRLDARTLMESCLERIAARETQTRALVDFDPAPALEAAQRAGPGRLHGIPFGVKDVLDTADLPAQYASGIWQGHRPRADAAAVAWARSEGAVMLGKTVTTEFAVRKPGPTTNPHNPAHTPGGSSSGSAAAVADFYFPVAIGTQTAGSTIRPAAYCGIVGYKPTFGLIPRAGMKLMSESLDTIGVMARSVADCALFAGAMARRDLGDPERKTERLPRVGIYLSPAWDGAQPETVALVERLRDTLAGHGVPPVPFELPAEFDALYTSYHTTVQFRESAMSLGWELAYRREDISADLRGLLDQGLATGEAALNAAYAGQARCREAFDACLGELDFILTPSAPGQAPKGLADTGSSTFNRLWTSLHVPCVTVPAGTGPDGLPLGIQLVARRGQDAQLLAWARWLQHIMA